MSLYRCAECGHGRHLTACAQAVASGPLDPDGTLAQHDDVSECFVFEDSIQCDVHPSAVIEKKIGARFGRWLPCPECNGSGKRDWYLRCRACMGEGARWQLVVASSVAGTDTEAQA